MQDTQDTALVSSPAEQPADAEARAGVSKQPQLWDRIFSWRGVAFLCVSWVVLLLLLGSAQGLGYHRFSIRGQDCYDPKTYYKFDEGVTKDLDTCQVLSYPYRLREPWWGSRSFAWSMYLTHQFGQWVILAQAQRAHRQGEIDWPSSSVKGTGPEPSTGGCPVGGLVNKYAIRMFCLNMFVVFCKLFFGQIFYDGLANDVPEWSAQYSVMLWIFFAVIMKMPTRGLTFGYIRGLPFKAGLVPDLVAYLRKFHGYAFSFGTCYNFWYHPVEGSPGFVLGYLYQFCMILQSGFLFHPMHKNKWWNLMLELAVVPHAAVIALFFANTDGMSSVITFGFGFAVLGLITHMHGLDLSKRVRACVAVAVLGCIPIAYLVTGRSLSLLPSEVLRIPIMCCMVPFAVWIGWVAGALLLWPFRPIQSRLPWTLSAFWFFVWAAQMGYFLSLGPLNPETTAELASERFGGKAFW